MSGLAYLVDALGGFAGGLSGALRSQQGQGDLGNALSSLFGGGGSGQSGGPMSGGGSYNPVPIFSGSGQGQSGGGGYQGQTNLDLPTATGQPQAGPGIGAGPLAAQIAGGAPQPPVASQASQSGGNYGYSAPPSQGQGQGQGSNMPSPVGQTNQSQGAPAMAQGQGASASIGRGPLTLASLVGAIKQHNPNISGQHLAAAVEKAIPLLNMEGLQQYRGIQQQLAAERQQDLQMDRADRSADRKQGMLDRKQIAYDKMQEQTDRFSKTFEQKKQIFDTTMDYKKARAAANDVRELIKQKLEAQRTWIQTYYAGTDEQKKEMYDKAKQAADDAEKSLNEGLAQKKQELEGKGTSENDKTNTQGSQTAKPKVSDEQKATWKKQAQDAIAAGKDPAWISKKYKELTGEDLGQ